MISIIVAYDKNYGIGKKNNITWKISDDIKIFRKLTEKKYIIMGRKTFESIGRPLPKRKNIILTKNKNYKQNKCYIINSIKDAINFINLKSKYEIFIIGGSQIYNYFLPYAKRLYITEIDAKIKNLDTFFPKWNKNYFKQIYYKKFKKNNKNQFNFKFKIFDRIKY